MWKYSKDGDFSTNSAYQLANEDDTTGNQLQGQWLWKLDVLPKIISFLWLCVHGSIPVKSVLAARGINCGKTCPLCNRHEETIVHLLRDCEVAHDLWCRLGVPASHINSFNENFENRLKINCLSTVRHNTSIPWSSLFLFAVWCLWKNRNKVVFENTIPNPRLDKDCIGQAREYFLCVSNSRQVSSKIAIPVRWTKPLDGWHKLNMDGALCGNPGKAVGGGVIKDCHGGWVKGFSRSIGHATSVMAEWWALRDGLILAIQLGINQLEVELESKVIVEMLNSVDCPNRSYAPLLCDCRSLMVRFMQV